METRRMKAGRKAGTYGGTRRFILRFISENGNHVRRDQLFDMVLEKTDVGTRQGVKYHVDDLLKTGKMTEDQEGYLRLAEPVSPNPLESWRIMGIPLSISFLWISLMEQNMFFTVASATFMLYAFTVAISELLFYYRLKIKIPLIRAVRDLLQKLRR